MKILKLKIEIVLETMQGENDTRTRNHYDKKAINDEIMELIYERFSKSNEFEEITVETKCTQEIQ